MVVSTEYSTANVAGQAAGLCLKLMGTRFPRTDVWQNQLRTSPVLWSAESGLPSASVQPPRGLGVRVLSGLVGAQRPCLRPRTRTPSLGGPSLGGSGLRPKRSRAGERSWVRAASSRGQKTPRRPSGTGRVKSSLCGKFNPLNIKRLSNGCALGVCSLHMCGECVSLLQHQQVLESILICKWAVPSA